MSGGKLEKRSLIVGRDSIPKRPFEWQERGYLIVVLSSYTFSTGAGSSS